METKSDVVAEVHEAEDTHDRILVSARKLFADKGFDATSVRDITSEAGCNVASVNYHFGGKDNLYLETFRSMLTVLRDQRLSVLDELMAAHATPVPRGVSASRLRRVSSSPWSTRAAAGSSWRLVSREMIDARLPQDVFLNEFFTR